MSSWSEWTSNDPRPGYDVPGYYDDYIDYIGLSEGSGYSDADSNTNRAGELQNLRGIIKQKIAAETARLTHADGQTNTDSRNSEADEEIDYDKEILYLRKLLDSIKKDLANTTTDSKDNHGTKHDYYSEDYDDDGYVDPDEIEPPTVMNCTCSSNRTSQHVVDKELQFRERHVIQEGTIGGKSCNHSSYRNLYEIRQCACTARGKNATFFVCKSIMMSR